MATDLARDADGHHGEPQPESVAGWTGGRRALRCSGCRRPYRASDLVLQTISSAPGWIICRQCLWGQILGKASPIEPVISLEDIADPWEDILHDEFWSGER